MIFVYRLLINIILILSPLIIIFRLIKKKKVIKDLKKNFVYFQSKDLMEKLCGFMEQVWVNCKV